MRYLIASLLIAAVLVSGCVSFDEFGEARTGIPQVTMASVDIQLDVEPFPVEVKAGRNMSVYFDIWNKHEDMEITDIDVSIYDPCVFIGDSDPIHVWTDETLGRNRTKSDDIELVTGDVDFERNCELKFSASYEADIFRTQSVIVLQEAEYYQREQAGTLENLTATSSASNNPLSIAITFSEQQPFLENEQNIMYIDYSYSGEGYIDSLPVGSITMKLPDNMKSIDCNDYDLVGGEYSLNREKTFINKRVPRSTCTFTASASQPIDSKTITLEGTYKYSLDNSLLVKVKPR